MTSYLDTDPEMRPDLPTRERVAGKTEVQCPSCGAWRPGFCVSSLPETTEGHDWACDGCITRWARVPVVPTLEQVRAEALRAIDAAAEAARAAYLTPGSGQALEYQQVAAEASQYLMHVAAEVEPDPADYPMLAYEAAARDVPLAQVVTEVMDAVQVSTLAGRVIRVRRLAAKAAVRAAETPEAVAEAMQVDWTILAEDA